MAHVRDLLEAHEAQLTKQLKQLRDQLIPLERELADVRRARAILMTGEGPEQQQIAFPEDDEKANSHEMVWRRRLLFHHAVPPKSPYSGLTIKELVKKALREQFAGGATAGELLDFFKNAWGRGDIARTSLSPQLSRLKQGGKISLAGQRWTLVSEHPESGSFYNNKAAADQ